jgi:hypothetical protein
MTFQPYEELREIACDQGWDAGIEAIQAADAEDPDPERLENAALEMLSAARRLKSAQHARDRAERGDES